MTVKREICRYVLDGRGNKMSAIGRFLQVAHSAFEGR